jgi:hypothetical protein
MADQGISVKYDGGDARNNTIDAKLFGQSLQGLDRMVSDCLIVLSQSRLPKRGERAPLLLKAREPESGSVNVPQLLQEASDLLGIGVPILSAIGPEIVGYYVSAVLDHFKGKDAAVELAITKMAEMHQVALSAMVAVQRDAMQTVDQMDERRHQEVMGMQSILRASIMGSGAAAVDYVAPVGLSVDTATFVTGDAISIEIDKDGADAIRASQKLDWTSPQNEVVTTDGFKFHTSGLSIENPEADGFLMAEVNDPVFDQESNPYTIAAQKRAKIEVLARKGYKNGNLARVLILDFIREINDHAA